MNLLEFINKTYAKFLSLFPADIHWLISLVALIGLAVGFFNLIRRHWIFLIVAVIFLPFLVPIIATIFDALFEFGRMLFGQAEKGVK